MAYIKQWYSGEWQLLADSTEKVGHPKLPGQ
jgi:hypothetical protein